MKHAIAPVAFRPCRIDDCTGVPKARGWCAKHYERWRLYGGPLLGPPFRSKKPVGDWLSPPLLEIWRQLVIGGSNKEIAQRLNLQPCTVKNYLTELYFVLALNPNRSRAHHSRTVATLWGMEILFHHPDVFKDAERRNQ